MNRKIFRRDCIGMAVIAVVFALLVLGARSLSASNTQQGPEWQTEGEVLNNALGEVVHSYVASDDNLRMTVVCYYGTKGKKRYVKSVRLYKSTGGFDRHEEIAAVRYLNNKAFYTGTVKGVKHWKAPKGLIMSDSLGIVYIRRE